MACKSGKLIFMVQKTILTDKPEKLALRYRELLLKRGIPVEKIIIFGSYAKKTPKPWSDLDLCVVSKSFGKNSYDETVKLKLLTTGIDTMIEPHPYHPRDLASPWDPLAAEIKKHGRIVK